MHSTKIARAWKLSGIPAMPSVRATIAAAIRPTLIERLTAAELAEVILSLDGHWHSAMAHAERSCSDEGAIWDNRRQVLREVAL